MQHTHAQLIKAWADGAQIEYFNPATKEWGLVKYPDWDANAEYRVYDKFQELKEAYRKGKAIQYKDMSGWHDTDYPSFSEDVLYRIRPDSNQKYRDANPKSVEFKCTVCGAWHNLSNWQEILGGEVDWESTEFRFIKNANPKQEFIDAHNAGEVVEYWCESCRTWHRLGRNFFGWDLFDKYRIQTKVNPQVITVAEYSQLGYEYIGNSDKKIAIALAVKHPLPNCLFTFDANTKELLDVQMIKY